MARARDFFTPTQRDQIKAAIEEAELLTSGEIRLHLENRVLVDVLDRAAYVFDKLGMHQTKYRNAVLIYMAIEDHKFAILGDSGIHEVLGHDYWQGSIDLMGGYFKEGDFCKGLEEVILDIGNKLKEHFPIDPDDVNELENEISDEISMNEN